MIKPRTQRRLDDSILLFGPDLNEVNGFAGALNTNFFSYQLPEENGGWKKVHVDYHPVKQELRRLVKAWFESGKNFGKLRSAEPILAREAQSVRARIIPGQDGRARLIYVTTPEKMDPGDPAAIAIGLFLEFVLNPDADRLVGPCPHCDKYFVQRSRRQTVYCSKKCGVRQTAKAALRNRRRTEQSERLATAQKALKRWAQKRRNKGWKIWVSEHTLISKNWLTRAEMRKELEIPKHH